MLSYIIKLASELGEIRAKLQASLRLPARPQMWPGLTHTGPVADASTENKETTLSTGPAGHALTLVC